MRLWHFSSSVNSFLKCAFAAIQWGHMSDFCRTLRLLPYFMCANNEGSGETARMRRLAWALAGRLCDKDIISWAGSFEIQILSLKFHLPSLGQVYCFQTLNVVFPHRLSWFNQRGRRQPAQIKTMPSRALPTIRKRLILAVFWYYLECYFAQLT